MSALTIRNMLGLNISVVPDTIIVSRDWKERLFTAPWRPMRKTKVVNNPHRIAYGVAIQTSHGLLVSPSTFEDIKSNTTLNPNQGVTYH